MNSKERLAMNELKVYGLSCDLIFDNLNFNGKYDSDTDTIYIHKSLSKKDFMMTLYHEINHAIHRLEMGAEDYKNDYELEMERCILSDLDPYKDNYYEVAAEKFAKQKTKEEMLWAK